MKKIIIRLCFAMICLVALTFIGLWLCDYKIMKMGNSSMDPTYRKGDYVLINLTAYLHQAPQRWEVVMYEGQDGKLWIHRVIGLPGENLVISPDGLYINQQKVEKPSNLDGISYVSEEMLHNKNAGPPYKQYNIPKDNLFFLLGDNTFNSYDSRMIGYISFNKIRGKVQKFL